MIKIINGRKFDTATAEKLATYERPYKETLYRKKNGEFFLVKEQIDHCGCGGLQTNMARYSSDDAKMWVGNIKPEKYEDIFGKIDE